MTTLTVPDGANLVAFIRDAVGAQDAWVSAVGLLADVTLAPSIETKTLARTISERVLLLSLQGTRQGPLFVTLGLSAADGITVTGGVLEKAVALGVTVYVETPPPVIPAKAGVPAAKPVVKPPDDEADETPRGGDFVDHFVFGVCEVMTVRDERMKIREVKGGKLREISVGAMKVLKPIEENGHKLFKLVRRS
jgi:hypothetical protein